MFGVIKCHRCNHIWIYTGQSLSTICPDCKTTVRVQKRQIPINWDFEITTEDLSSQQGQAIPFIEKWGNKTSLKLCVVAEDAPVGQTLPFTFPLISGLITQEELKEATGGQNSVSGGYPLPMEMKTKLKKMEFK